VVSQLAKEAAKESMSLNEQYNVITMSDVKQAVKTSTKIKLLTVYLMLSTHIRKYNYPYKGNKLPLIYKTSSSSVISSL
jgi:hypothetical protein